MGDIHGAHIPLKQCLERCGFNKDKDKLITLGDICDGWPYVKECVDSLLEIDTINIIGNHDEWFLRWLKIGIHPDNWRQGGMGTAKSYIRYWENLNTPITEQWDLTEAGERIKIFSDFNHDWIPETHRNFFEKQQWYYKDEKNRLFVHGGFLKDRTLRENQRRPLDEFYFHWNRDLWEQALSAHNGEKLKFAEEFSEIFIGHTETTNWTKYKKAPNSLVLMPTLATDCPPMHADIIWNLDTGAGSTGRLTIMDVDTHEYWQSDLVNEIYGDYKPRG
jgi:serine/threonine protein phosphatase 1